MAGTIAGTVVLDVPGVELSGTLGLEINTGTARPTCRTSTVGDDLSGRDDRRRPRRHRHRRGARGRRASASPATSPSPRPAPARPACSPCRSATSRRSSATTTAPRTSTPTASGCPHRRRRPGDHLDRASPRTSAPRSRWSASRRDPLRHLDVQLQLNTSRRAATVGSGRRRGHAAGRQLPPAPARHHDDPGRSHRPQVAVRWSSRPSSRSRSPRLPAPTAASAPPTTAPASRSPPTTVTLFVGDQGGTPYNRHRRDAQERRHRPLAHQRDGAAPARWQRARRAASPRGARSTSATAPRPRSDEVGAADQPAPAEVDEEFVVGGAHPCARPPGRPLPQGRRHRAPDHHRGSEPRPPT